MGVPGIGTCQSNGKERKTTQYVPSTVKDLTSARTQNALSSSNMAKPITIQFEKNKEGDVLYKGCGRCPLFVPCVARKYMEFLPLLLEVRVYHVGIRIFAKRKETFPYPPLSNNLFKGTQI